MPKMIKKPLSLFDVKSAPYVRKKLLSGLKFPFVHVDVSRLGGDKNVSIIVTISKDAKSKWENGILHNSRYGMFHIENDGTVEFFSGRSLKMRKFTAKNVDTVIDKINNVKSSGR